MMYLDHYTYKAYPITPIPKPRMTQRDRWAKRTCVERYYAFKDEVRSYGITVPECEYHVVFQIPMPKSWSKKKKQEMFGQPHQQKPDKDNLEKALLDAIHDEDCRIWDGRVTKIWGDAPLISIGIKDND